MNNIANLAAILREYPQSDKALDASSILNTRFGVGKWLYCGWANRRLGLNTSPLANPYSCRPNARAERIRVSSRDEAVECFRQWLWSQIKGHNVAVIEALLDVTPSATLVCWCAPKRCHCEVISRAAKWLNTLPIAERLKLLCVAVGFRIKESNVTCVNGPEFICPEWRATYSVGQQFITIIHRAYKDWEWTIETEFMTFKETEDDLLEWLRIILKRIKHGGAGGDWFKYRLTDIPNKPAEERKQRLRKLGFL